MPPSPDLPTLLHLLQSRDRSLQRLLESQQAKEQNIQLLAEELRVLRIAGPEKERDLLRLNGEIQQAHAAANERLDSLIKLDHELTLCTKRLRELEPGRDVSARYNTPAEEEVLLLRLQLAAVRRKLQASQGRLARQAHELETLRHLQSGQKLTGLQRWLNRWGARLAARTPYPLGVLQQYEARPLHLETFPRPPRLRRWPRICLATPSYQQAVFLERTMQSVLDQQYPNLAYGVQDGGSTDGSAAIIERHIAQLAHAESAPDKGQSDAIQRGFKKLYPTTHDIMGWVNSDDTLMPGALHYIGAYFAQNPDVDVIYGHRVVIDDEDREVGRWYLPRYHANTLKWFDLVPQETLFWRAHCYQEIGGLDTSFQFALDWDLLARFEQACFNIRRVPYFLGRFRVHQAQKTSAKIQTVGEHEMKRLRRRIHDREVPSSEVHHHLAEEIQRSAVVERLHRMGWRH